MVHQRLPQVTTAAVAALVLLSVGCLAQEAAECDNKGVIANFNVTAYMGKWYEYAKFGSTPYEEGGVCVMAEYTQSPGNITVVNSKEDNKTHEVNSTTGWAEFASDTKDAKLTVHFPGAPATEGNYQVLSTDYHNYSIVWSCSKPPGSPTVIETSWILLRSRSPSNATLAEVDQDLKQVGFTMEKYMKTQQEACAGAGHLFGAVISIVMAFVFVLLH